MQKRTLQLINTTLWFKTSHVRHIGSEESERENNKSTLKDFVISSWRKNFRRGPPTDRRTVKMSAQDQMRAMLDQLMGTARDGESGPPNSFSFRHILSSTDHSIWLMFSWTGSAIH